MSTIPIPDLANFGVLGLWTAFLIWEKYRSRKENREHLDKVMERINVVIDNNTTAIHANSATLCKVNDTFDKIKRLDSDIRLIEAKVKDKTKRK